MRSVVALICLVLCGTALAHDLNLNGIRIVEDSSGRMVTASAPISQIVSCDHLTDTADASIREALLHRLSRSVDVALGQPILVIDRANDTVSVQAAPSATIARIKLPLFPELPEAKTVVVRIKDGRTESEAVFGSQQAKATEPTSLRYLRMGVEHIATGLDHLAFVLGLMLVGRSLKSLIKAVTAFTVAHCVTLSLAATGAIHVPSRWVEPIIALSIVAIAIEALWFPDRDVRIWLACVFGLVHGFGFASALTEVGLPNDAIPLSLGSFNVGVELGQLAFLALAWPLLRLASAKWPQTATVLSWLITAAGSYWFVERLLSR